MGGHLMSKKLNAPSMAALRFFDSAARHLNFSMAAKELCVSPAAVSQQIRQLESNLGFKLFQRASRSRRLELTQEGGRLYKVVAPALLSINNEVQAIHRQCLQGVVTLRTLPSLGLQWLVARLKNFQARYPEIELRVEAEDSRVELTQGQFDIAIDLGYGPYENMETTTLMQENIFPVCSPAFMASGRAIVTPADLKQVTLLHDVTAWRDAGDHSEWEYWSKATGQHDLDFTKGPTFNRAFLTLHAAINGQGVAMGREALINDEISSGQLVDLFPSLHVETRNNYHLVYAKGALDNPRVKALHDWLVEQTQLKV